MFYKLMEMSRSFVRCSSKCSKYKDGPNLMKDMISNALSTHESKFLKRILFVIPKYEMHKVVRNKSLLSILANELKQMQGIFKENTIKVTKSCVSQFEFVIAHRVRRAQQVFSLYSKLWDDKTLRIIVTKLRKQLMLKGRAFMLGLSAAAVFNWDEEMIRDHEFNSHNYELDLCRRLKDRRSKPEKPDNSSCQSCDSSEEDACWEPFVNNGDLSCWRREAPHKRGTGRYCYKVYGAYSDVSANDFLEAFLDVKERKSWDTHVVNLHVITSDPNTNSDLIYWEIKYPTLFSNRDYVYKRRYKILEKENLIIVCNRSTSHPDYPVKSNITRVSEYWSFLVIKPFTSFSQTGMEFSLTYFDDPGTALPSAISSWASSVAMPEFMKKLRLAAIKVADNKVSTPTEIQIPEEEKAEQKETIGQVFENKDENCDSNSESNFFGLFSFFYPPSNEDDLIFQMLIS